MPLNQTIKRYADIYLFIHLSKYLSMFLSIYLSKYLSILLSIYLKLERIQQLLNQTIKRYAESDIYLFIYPSKYLSIFLSIYPSIYLVCRYLSISLYKAIVKSHRDLLQNTVFHDISQTSAVVKNYLSIYPSIYLSIQVSIYLSKYLSIYLSKYLSIFLSTHLKLERIQLLLNRLSRGKQISIYLSEARLDLVASEPNFLSFYLPTSLFIYLSIYLSIQVGNEDYGDEEEYDDDY